MSADDLIRDPATIRATWEDDADVTRIIRRVHAALNSGTDRAVVAVVLDETDKARAGVDELRASVTEYEGSLQAAQSRLAIERAKVAAVESVCMNTDGDYLDGDVEIPVGEVLRMIYGDIHPALGVAP